MNSIESISLIKSLPDDDAADIDENATPGEYVEVPIDSVEFGRISAQMAKQVIVQKVREAERDQVTDEYKDREGGVAFPV